MLLDGPLRRALALPHSHRPFTANGPTSQFDDEFRRALSLPTSDNTLVTGGRAECFTVDEILARFDGEHHEARHLPLPSRQTPAWVCNRRRTAEILARFFRTRTGCTGLLYAHEVCWTSAFISRIRDPATQHVSSTKRKHLDEAIEPLVELRFDPHPSSPLGVVFDWTALAWLGTDLFSTQLRRLPREGVRISTMRRSERNGRVVSVSVTDKFALGPRSPEFDHCYDELVHPAYCGLYRRATLNGDGFDLSRWWPDCEGDPSLLDLQLIKGTVWRPNAENELMPYSDAITFGFERESGLLAYIATGGGLFNTERDYEKSALSNWLLENS